VLAMQCPGLSQSTTPNGIQIQSAVFPQSTGETDRWSRQETCIVPRERATRLILVCFEASCEQVHGRRAVPLRAGESCYINVANGNSSYTPPPPAAAAGGGSHGDGCHGNELAAVCGMTLTDPVNYYNDRVLGPRMRTDPARSHQQRHQCCTDQCTRSCSCS